MKDEIKEMLEESMKKKEVSESDFYEELGYKQKIEDVTDFENEIEENETFMPEVFDRNSEQQLQEKEIINDNMLNQQELEYKEMVKDDIISEQELDELLQQLREMKEQVQRDLELREGYQEYKAINVVHYNKDAELISLENGEIEYLDLDVVIAEDPNTKEIIEIYLLDGKEANILELNTKYESALPIIKLINDTKENLKLSPDKQDEELIKVELVDLEERKLGKDEKVQDDEKEDKEIKDEKEEDETEKENKKEEKEEEKQKKSLTGIKPKYLVQTIDVDKTYVDDRTTVRRAFKIPEPVQHLAIAKPMQEDENVLATDMTLYMLDSSSRVIENVDGKTIKDFFEPDDATGKNPREEENAKFELDGYAERNKNHTMRRFTSKENSNMHLSVEQKTIADYNQVYAGRKTMNGNDTVEVQLETRNIPVQTSLEMQKIAAGYKGLRNTNDISEEVDKDEAEGKDIKNIKKENADGKENQDERLKSPYIPGTEITWEELADKTGESIPKLEDRFQRELDNGKEPADILDEIEYDYEMVGYEHEHKIF